MNTFGTTNLTNGAFVAMAPIQLRDIDCASDVTDSSDVRSYYDPNMMAFTLAPCAVPSNDLNNFMALQQQHQQQLQLQLKMQSFMTSAEEYEHDVTATTTPRSISYNPSEADMYQNLATQEQVEDGFGALSARGIMPSDSTSTIVTVDTMSECSFSMGPPQKSYPVVVISPGGLVTILLDKEVAVEMTLDRAIRVVNHRHRAVAAVNQAGDLACVHHQSAKIYHDGDVTETAVYWQRRVRMCTEGVYFSCENTSYLMSPGCRSLLHSTHAFQDLSRDMSVTVLFTSSGYGPHLVDVLEELVHGAHYDYFDDGSVSVEINKCLIRQEVSGDVTVTTEESANRVRVSPDTGSVWLETGTCQMSIEANYDVMVQSGERKMSASYASLIVADGENEAGFAANRRPFLRSLNRASPHAVIKTGRVCDVTAYDVCVEAPPNEQPPFEQMVAPPVGDEQDCGDALPIPVRLSPPHFRPNFRRPPNMAPNRNSQYSNWNQQLRGPKGRRRDVMDAPEAGERILPAYQGPPPQCNGFIDLDLPTKCDPAPAWFRRGVCPDRKGPIEFPPHMKPGSFNPRMGCHPEAGDGPGRRPGPRPDFHPGFNGPRRPRPQKRLFKLGRAHVYPPPGDDEDKKRFSGYVKPGSFKHDFPFTHQHHVTMRGGGGRGDMDYARRKAMTSNAKQTSQQQAMTRNSSSTKTTKTSSNTTTTTQQRKSEHTKPKAINHLVQPSDAKMESHGDSAVEKVEVASESAEKTRDAAGEGGEDLSEVDAFHMKEFSESFVNDVVLKAVKNVKHLHDEDAAAADVTEKPQTASVGVTASPADVNASDDVIAEIPVKNRSKSVPELSVCAQTTDTTHARVEPPRDVAMMEASPAMTSATQDKGVMTSASVGAAGEGLVGSKRAPEVTSQGAVQEKQAKTEASE